MRPCSSGGTIVGVGLIAGQLTVRSGGTVNANNGFALNISGSPGINAGKVEATGGGVLFIESDLVNSASILASGTGAGIGIQNATSAIPAPAWCWFPARTNRSTSFGGTILGGKLQTTKNAFVLATTGNNAISGTTIVSGSDVQAVGGTLTATNVTIGANTELAAFNGAVLTVSGGVIGKGDAVGAGRRRHGADCRVGGQLRVHRGVRAGAGCTRRRLSTTPRAAFSPRAAAPWSALSGATISGGQWQTASGGIVETASGSHNVISSATIVSGSVIEVADGGELTLSGAIANAGTFAVSAAVSAATLDLGGATLSGGRLATSGASALIETVSGTVDMIRGGTIVSGSHLAVVSASTLTLSGGSVGAGATVSATSGSTLIVSGTLANSGTLALSGVTSVAAHATLATLSGGSAIVTGTVVNSSTFTASGLGTLIEIGSGGVVSGGAVVVGNGIVDVLSGGSANVAFLSNGSGGLEIEDSANNASAFTGKVSGFGGAGHANRKQFIDLISVAFVRGIPPPLCFRGLPHQRHAVRVERRPAVAAINIIGAYTSANFSAKADSSGNVEITDPAVPNGGSAPPNLPAARPRSARHRLRRADDARLCGER